MLLYMLFIYLGCCQKVSKVIREGTYICESDIYAHIVDIYIAIYIYIYILH